jgi:uncharacterized protein (DUF1330 family)
MPKGYLIANVDVSDAEAYKAYVAENGVAFAKYGGRFLVRAGQREVPEGQFRARLVVLEFPSYQAASDCYHSPEYAKAIALRRGASVADIAVIEGYGGPQPGEWAAPCMPMKMPSPIARRRR